MGEAGLCGEIRFACWASRSPDVQAYLKPLKSITLLYRGSHNICRPTRRRVAGVRDRKDIRVWHPELLSSQCCCLVPRDLFDQCLTGSWSHRHSPVVQPYRIRRVGPTNLNVAPSLAVTPA